MSKEYSTVRKKTEIGALSTNPYIEAGFVDISRKGDESKLLSPSGNVFFGFPHGEIIRRLCFDTEDEFCNLKLGYGAIKKMVQVPKDQMEAYLKSSRYEAIKKCKFLYISCPISEGARSLEDVLPVGAMAKLMTRKEIKKVAKNVEMGKITSELKHDAEYSIQYCCDYLFGGRVTGVEYIYSQCLKEEDGKCVFAQGCGSNKRLDGSRYFHTRARYYSNFAFGVSLCPAES